MTTNNPELPLAGTPIEAPATLEEAPQTAVPHSGVHFDEKPHTEFGSTSLEEADARNLLVIPEDPSALIKNNRNRNIALIAGGAVLAAGSFIGVQLATGDKPSKTATVTEAPQAPSVDTKTALGIVRVNESDILVTRPSGEKMLVPRLRGESPSEFADSFLTLLACYITTGEEACVSAATNIPNVREVFIGSRRDFDVQKHHATSYLKSAQFEIFGSPLFFANEIPAKSTPASKYYFIRLNPETELRADVQIGTNAEETKWQSHLTNEGGDYKFKDLSAEYTINNNGDVNVVAFKYTASPLR